MNELISVIINVYNGEKYLEKCILSVINQTYKKLEIIIVNDGSTDNSLQLCESFKDERIRIVNQENRGLSYSRNIGLENARGEYVYFIDQDDFIDSDIIEYLYNLCKQYNVLISTCRPFDIYSYDFKLKKPKEKVSIISNKEMLRIFLLNIDTSTPVWNKLIKKELFNDIKFDENLFDDATAVTYKIVLKVNQIAYSNQFKYFYFNHSEGMSKKANPKLIIDEYRATIQRYYDIETLYPNFIANRVCVLSYIAKVFFIGNEQVQVFLKQQDAVKLFNKLFSARVLICNMKFREKVKVVLFRINPNLFKGFVSFYLKLKRYLLNEMNKIK